MTSRPDDELVTSVLDGEASAAARAAVASDPALRARLDVFASVQREVQALEVDDELADRIRLAALAAAEAGDPPDAGAPVAPLRPMAPLRARPKVRRRASGALAAAAVVVIGILGFATLRPDGDDSSVATSGSTESSVTEAPGAMSAAPDADATAAPVRDLGAVPDVAALAAAWRAGRATLENAAKAAAPASAGSAGPGQPSAAPVADRCGTAVGYATLDGRAVVLLADADVIRVLDPARCLEVARFVP